MGGRGGGGAWSAIGAGPSVPRVQRQEGSGKVSWGIDLGKSERHSHKRRNPYSNASNILSCNSPFFKEFSCIIIS